MPKTKKPRRAGKGGPRLLYRDPLGSCEPVPAIEDLREVILATGTEYWKRGSGDAEIRFSSRKRESCLGIMYKSGHGICLMHNYLKDPAETGDMYVSVAAATYERKTSVFVGGDFFRFPIAFFIPRDLAWEAVLDFCESGGRSAKVTWKRRMDIHAFREDEEIHGDPY